MAMVTIVSPFLQCLKAILTSFLRSYVGLGSTWQNLDLANEVLETIDRAKTKNINLYIMYLSSVGFQLIQQDLVFLKRARLSLAQINKI